jgi:hypothetical protein
MCTRNNTSCQTVIPAGTIRFPSLHVSHVPCRRILNNSHQLLPHGMCIDDLLYTPALYILSHSRSCQWHNMITNIPNPGSQSIRALAGERATYGKVTPSRQSIVEGPANAEPSSVKNTYCSSPSPTWNFSPQTTLRFWIQNLDPRSVVVTCCALLVPFIQCHFRWSPTYIMSWSIPSFQRRSSCTCTCTPNLRVTHATLIYHDKILKS